MIYFLGDVHGKMDHILPAIRDRRGSASLSVVFLGDIQAQRPFEDEIRPLTDAGIGVWFIHGNHDTDSAQHWRHIEQSSHRSLHGRVVEIEGLRVGGMGGVFRGEIWYPDRPRLSSPNPVHHSYRGYVHSLQTQPHAMTGRAARRAAGQPGGAQQGLLLRHHSSIFMETYEALMGQKADILVTHEAPSCHRLGFKTIDRLAQAMGVGWVFHGHQHESPNYRAWESELGFKTFGVGLRGITDGMGRQVLPGEPE